MPWLDGLGFSLQLITLGFGGFLVITGRMTLGNLVAFNSYLWMIDGPVRQSGWLINDWQRFNASCIKIRKLLTAQSRITEKPENTEKPETAPTRITPARITPAQRLQPLQQPTQPASQAASTSSMSASPSPTNQTPLCLKTSTSMFRQAPNSAFSAKPARANPPSSTSSPASTTPPKAMCSSTASTRETGRSPHCARKVCVVAQDTFLFSDTIGGNISFGAGEQREYDEQYIRRMATIAGADGFIRSMPEGYDTVVGERGVGLSGGQNSA